MDTITFTVREQEALRRLGVTGIILFGSQARGLAGAASDYDVGVLRVQSTADVHQEKALYEEL
ncbi:MAG: nucleotidyltransferase domain-containing protein [Patescibacteria group bacterium]